MDVGLIAGVLARRSLWRRRDRWDEERIGAHQDAALATLRQHAYARSAFYRRLHAGLERAPLHELPTVTKAELMSRFDEAVTEPGLHLRDLEAHLAELEATDGDPGKPWRGTWWAAQTAGTTGRRGVFVWNRSEWATVLAS